METWSPISRDELEGLIDDALLRMPLPQRHLWDGIRIEPYKWVSHPYGDMGGGFWAVAVMGPIVLWYNDIEEGFNYSNYTKYGNIDGYWCNQDRLDHAIQALLYLITRGTNLPPQAGPPEKL